VVAEVFAPSFIWPSLGDGPFTMLPIGVGERLREQLQQVRRLHQKDLTEGYGKLQLPRALARKYKTADR
jgi:hypothetical protein